jgi:hypothetical protein
MSGINEPLSDGGTISTNLDAEMLAVAATEVVAIDRQRDVETVVRSRMEQEMRSAMMWPSR